MPKFLITGSNRGIGLELARQLQERGDYVIATCRNNSEELINLGVNIIDNVDISSGHSITKSPLSCSCLVNSRPIPRLEPVIKNFFKVSKKLDLS